MAGCEGMKRWWSSNPVLGCALGGLGVVAFLFLFPFMAVLNGAGWMLESFVEWIQIGLVLVFNFLMDYFRPFYAVVVFFVVFFLCLRRKKPQSKAVERLMSASVGVLIGSVVFVLASSLALDTERAEARMKALDTRAYLSMDRQEVMRTCIFSQSPILTSSLPGVPAQGPTLFTCEKKPNGELYVAERALSQVDLNKLSCNPMDCHEGLWQVSYAPAAQALVFEAQTGVRLLCRKLVMDLPVPISDVKVNGRPASESECRSGMNKIEVTYSPSWLKPVTE